MSRLPLRTHARRLALGLSLMLVAGAIAAPAFGAPEKKSFSATVSAVDPETDGASFAVTVAVTNTSDNVSIGSVRVTAPSGITIVGAVASAGSLSTAPTANPAVVDGLFLAPSSHADVLVLSVTAAACGTPYSFTVEAKQSNSFNGERGNGLRRDSSSQLSITPACADPGEPSGPQTVEDGNTAWRLLDRPDGWAVDFRLANDDDEKAAIQAECDKLEIGDVQLMGSELVLFDPQAPVGYEGGADDFVLQVERLLVSRADFRRNVNAYQVCFVGDKADFHDETLPEIGGTGFFGPVLLPNCDEAVPAPCVVERQQQIFTGQYKSDSNVKLRFRIPAEDPFLR